ncbi:hypothetical protein Peur_046814 [Populus x canadensis]
MDYEKMALLSLTSLWWFSTSQYGLPYQPSGPSQPSFWAEHDSNGATRNSIITYAQLNDSVQLISTRLVLQLQRGDTVVILCSPGLELVEIYL